MKLELKSNHQNDNNNYMGGYTNETIIIIILYIVTYLLFDLLVSLYRSITCNIAYRIEMLGKASQQPQPVRTHSTLW